MSSSPAATPSSLPDSAERNMRTKQQLSSAVCFVFKAGRPLRCRRPDLGEQLGLLQHGAGRLFLLIRRVTVFAEDAPDEDAHLGTDVLTQRPVDGHALAHGCDQLAGDR